MAGERKRVVKTQPELINAVNLKINFGVLGFL